MLSQIVLTPVAYLQSAYSMQFFPPKNGGKNNYEWGNLRMIIMTNWYGSKVDKRPETTIGDSGSRSERSIKAKQGLTIKAIRLFKLVQKIHLPVAWSSLGNTFFCAFVVFCKHASMKTNARRKDRLLLFIYLGNFFFNSSFFYSQALVYFTFNAAHSCQEPAWRRVIEREV